MSMHMESMSISSFLIMNVLGRVMFTLLIGNPIPWINSSNLKLN